MIQHSTKHTKLSLIVLSLYLWLAPNFSYLMANAIADAIPTPPAATEHAPKPPHDDCKCKRPFKRFVVALETLERDNMISKEDTKKVMDALMEIPRETLNRVEDKDQAAADMLYKDKVLTETQYQKITELLKSSAKKH